MSFLQFNLEDRSPFDRRFFISKDARRPDLEVQLLDSVSGVDLSGAAVTFSLEDRQGVVKVNAAAAVLVAGTEGKLTYSWESADVDTEGVFIGRFTAIISGRSYIIPNNSDQQLIITIGEKVN